MKAVFWPALALVLVSTQARANLEIEDRACDATLCAEDIDSVTLEAQADEQSGAQAPAPAQAPAQPAASAPPAGTPPETHSVALGFRRLLPFSGFHFAGAVSTNAGLSPSGQWQVIPAFAMVAIQYIPTPKLVIFGRVTPNSANALSELVWAPDSPIIQGIRYLTAQTLGTSPDVLTAEQLSAGIQRYRKAAFGAAGNWSARLREFGIIYRPENDFIAEISLGRQDSPHVQAFVDPGFAAYPFFSALRTSLTTKYHHFADGMQVALRVDAYSDAERSLVAFGSPIPGYIFARVGNVLANPDEPAISYKRPSAEATLLFDNPTKHAAFLKGFLSSVGRRSYGNSHWDSVYSITTARFEAKKTEIAVQFMRDWFQNSQSPGVAPPRVNTFNAQVVGPSWKSVRPKFETSILQSSDNSQAGIQGYRAFTGGVQYTYHGGKPVRFLGVNWSPGAAASVGREIAQGPGQKPVTIVGGGLVLQFFR
jgi:hypothetical protein